MLILCKKVFFLLAGELTHQPFYFVWQIFPYYMLDREDLYSHIICVREIIILSDMHSSLIHELPGLQNH